MKKIKISIFIIFLTLILTFCYKNVKVLAEDEQIETNNGDNLPSTELLDNDNTNTDVISEIKSKGQIWLEQNMNGIIAVICGGGLVVLGDALLLIKKGIELKKAIQTAKDTHDKSNNELKMARELFDGIKKLSNDMNSNIAKLSEAVVNNSLITDELKGKFDASVNAISNVNSRLNNLEKEFGVIVSNSKEYVVNGKAELINKIIGD